LRSERQSRRAAAEDTDRPAGDLVDGHVSARGEILGTRACAAAKEAEATVQARGHRGLFPGARGSFTPGGTGMSVDRSHQAQNDKERARLEALVGRLTDAELQRPMPGGWTVASVLAHLAYWDQRTYLLLDRWQREGVAPVDFGEANVDWINDAA